MTSGGPLRLVVPAGQARSKVADRMLDDLLALKPRARDRYLVDLTARDWQELAGAAQRAGGSPWALWLDDPTGFCAWVLGETLWSAQRRVLGSYVAEPITVVPAGQGLGKCAWEHDRLPLADGSMPTFGSLVGREFTLLAWATDGRQVPARARAEWNAVEPVWRVTTTSGRTVARNAEHPLWAATLGGRGREAGRKTSRLPERQGWRPLADLQPGDLVLVPERVRAEGQRPAPEHHAALLGYLLGDAHTGKAVVFTQMPGPALDEFVAVVEALDCRVVPLASRSRASELAVRGNGPRGRSRNHVLDLTREWGLAGVGAREKRLPGWAWTLPNEQLAVVLGRLLACDGWASTTVRANGGRHGEVGITLASEGLIRDVEAAMLRLGVWGRVDRKPHVNAWSWLCYDGEALARLASLVHVPGKQDAILRAVEYASDRYRPRRWPRAGAPPGYRWEQVREVEPLGEQRTVAVEVLDGPPAYVTTVVEHNTYLAARALVHWVACHPPGAATAVTTAVNMRQVRRQLWPDVGKVVAQAGLPGIVDTAQWRIPTAEGREFVAAYGFTAPVGNESAVQGIHAPRLLVIVEEAGGMEPTVGKAFRGLVGTEGARMIAVGNPPTDDEGSWFEGLANSPSVSRVDLPVTIGPEFTGEVTPRCRSCPPGLEAHTLAAHLHGRTWLQGVLEDYGEDSRWVQAKAYARFPEGGPDRVMRADDLEASRDPDPQRPHPPGSWVRMGVDVAAGGGDALAVSVAVGGRVRLDHVERGRSLANPVDVAGIVRRRIDAAQRLRAGLGTDAPLRVKIDAIGVGWGVAGILLRWAGEGLLGDCEIVPVVVSESVHADRQQDMAASSERPRTKRDELWLAGAALSRTLVGDGDGRAWELDVPRPVLGQLGAPRKTTTSQGYTVVESKDSMKKRGVRSPDEAESVLLAIYEPEPLVQPRKRRLVLSGGR